MLVFCLDWKNLVDVTDADEILERQDSMRSYEGMYGSADGAEHDSDDEDIGLNGWTAPPGAIRYYQ